MTLSLGVWGWTIVCVAIAASIIAGIRGLRSTQNADRSSTLDYVLSGRMLTAPLFAATLVATWYGSVLASGEFIVRNGIMFMFCFGMPYYLAALFYAVIVARRIRKSEALTLPENIKRVFGKRAAFVASLAVMVIAIPAPFMLSLGVLVSSLSGAPLWLSIAGGAVVSLIIVAKGGLRSDVAANIVQVILLFTGFGALTIGCIMVFGSVETMIAMLPEQTWDIPGNIGWTGVGVWLIIALQTFVDPAFHMRTAAARTPATASRGLILSVTGWVIFDIMQLTIGLYGLAFLPSVDAKWHFLNVAQAVLPDAMKGVFVAGLLASIMSALDGYSLACAATIGHDIMGAFGVKAIRKRHLVVGLLITGVIGTTAALVVPSIVDLIMMAASIAVPGLLLPLIVSVVHPLQRILRTSQGIPPWLWIALPSTVAAGCTLHNKLMQTDFPPMFIGLATSAILMPLVGAQREAQLVHTND